MDERTCTKCHQAKPATTDYFHRSGEGLQSTCKECKRAWSRRKYERDREQIIARTAAYAAANPEKRRAMSAAYLARPEVRERLEVSSKAWRESPVGTEKRRQAQLRFRATPHGQYACAISGHNARAREHGVLSDFTAHDWLVILENFNGECAYCGTSEGRITADHVVAMSRGGSNTAKNVVPACGPCNSGKSNRDMRGWYSTRRFYDGARLAKILQHME